jgi:hypothetical protein
MVPPHNHFISCESVSNPIAACEVKNIAQIATVLCYLLGTM